MFEKGIIYKSQNKINDNKYAGVTTLKTAFTDYRSERQIYVTEKGSNKKAVVALSRKREV